MELKRHFGRPAGLPPEAVPWVRLEPKGSFEMRIGMLDTDSFPRAPASCLQGRWVKYTGGAIAAVPEAQGPNPTVILILKRNLTLGQQVSATVGAEIRGRRRGRVQAVDRAAVLRHPSRDRLSSREASRRIDFPRVGTGTGKD